ncbi:spry domain containing socs box protein [Anaeramoeba flamelloides]|uniref:Spry domain containing socs box protein n=1 Tax=Anaeramoeba flamelloides TaxID=1746091 RepID=A0ABQ8XDB4_9EUKA|nr:spry domain containing socs box protein [Anaeramoeba flamelloides]
MNELQKELETNQMEQEEQLSEIRKTNEVFSNQYKRIGVEISENQKSVSFRKGCRVCCEKIYSKGIHEIEYQIEGFSNPNDDRNRIEIGVVVPERRETLINVNHDWAGTFWFRTWWQNNELSSWKGKDGSSLEKYGKPIKKGDRFTILLNMDEKEISFSINNYNYGIAFNNLPEKVSLFILAWRERGNKISLI